MADLSRSIRSLTGVGAQRAQALEKLGIRTLGDLLGYYPRTYEDRTVYCSIDSLVPDETVCVEATVAAPPRLSRVRAGMELVKLRVVDDSAAMDVTFFNQSYVRNQLLPGESYVFYGKVGGTPQRRSMTNPSFEPKGAGEITGRIFPIYRLCHGISNKLLLRLVTEALDECGQELPELLPAALREEHQLCSAPYACRNIHLPRDAAALALARRRLIFEELFTLSCAMSLLRATRQSRPGPAMTAVEPAEFYATLPFTPTAAQRRAVAELTADLCSGRQMSRLVQGDVGSGKTLVAAACLYLAWKNGWQSAFMAPTEILAEQHLRTMEGFLAPLGLRIGLLTGSMGSKARRQTLQQLADGALDVVIGTHALLSGGVEFAHLGLVVTDEQHRFGVEQRSALSGKGENPHVLVMSATPIPRTLSLIIYGDLDVSLIDELPPGRQSVQTFRIGESKRFRLNGFILRQVQEGHQVFVVCPKVEEDETGALLSATGHAQRLQAEFPGLRVGCVHGKMKSKDKDAAMAAFAAGETDVLVATTVVEVGVDVPNATLMVVENAERFGLSQLHQLRGRVGRGQAQSFCILVSDADNPDTRLRLDTLCKTNDGFKVAEADLRQRGPGDFFGERQHGLPEMHLADFCADMDVLNEAKTAAQALLRTDPRLEREENQPLLSRIKLLYEQNRDSLN